MADSRLRGKRAPIVDPVAHFKAHVDTSGGPDVCWPWTLSIIKTTGYGQFSNKAVGRKSAHVYAFELEYGPVPEGHHVDHTCHNEDLTCSGGITCPHRRCCNPRHLEAVTTAEDLRRANGPRGRGNQKTHCPQDHKYDEQNTMWITRVRKGKEFKERQCRACNRERVYLAKNGTSRPAPADVSLSRAGCDVCCNGHRYTPENTKYDSTTGKRRCRECARISARKANERRKKKKDLE